MIQVRRAMSRVLLGVSVAILAMFSSCASFNALKEAYPREIGSWQIHLEED